MATSIHIDPFPDWWPSPNANQGARCRMRTIEKPRQPSAKIGASSHAIPGRFEGSETSRVPQNPSNVGSVPLEISPEFES